MLSVDRLRHKDQSSPAAGQTVGQVISVRGSKASVGFLTRPPMDRSTVRATVGKFLGIATGESLLVGVITNVVIDAPALEKESWLALDG